ncbi:MAG: glycerophosphodiester phosphodiesterase [Actinobacteria bacterium]|nr:glycerophosphodiester phosphodiesterase [Actinomycetota bacterium]
MPLSRWAFLDSPPPIAFAHRGAHLDVAENTWMAFEAAAALGYRYIETDVRGTADGQVIICHDARARRLTGLSGLVSGFTLAELRAAPVVSDGAAEVPLLEEVLAGFPELLFNIDVKDRASAELVPGIIRQAGCYDRVFVTSFSWRRVRRVRAALAGQVCTGAPVAEFLRFLASPGSLAGSAQPAALQLPLSLRGVQVVTANLIRDAHAAGLPVHVWTLNDLASIRAALDMGADGIMTDQPVLLKEELTRRGAWH